jgi:DNA (cytosine-5)-methyltransferase 1
MTRGATLAGFLVVWGLDFNPNAARTWKENFPGAVIYEMWANELCNMPDPNGKLVVHVLHISPPCQVYSPAHTRAGRDDEMNFASLFAVQEVIKKARPRIVTLEQTFGILHDHFQFAFNSLIRMFTDNGFSVQWQVIELERYGLPQRRKRLIIIAAGPGETLPDFPAFTHSERGGNGLKPYTSAGSVLSSIPRHAANHDLGSVSTGARYVPWDDSKIIPNCITTAGANGRGHPSGKRGLTCREVASLQTFPHDHVFFGGQVRRQIGNAVPPRIGEILLTCVRKHLEKVDRAEMK